MKPRAKLFNNALKTHCKKYEKWMRILPDVCGVCCWWERRRNATKSRAGETLWLWRAGAGLLSAAKCPPREGLRIFPPHRYTRPDNMAAALRTFTPTPTLLLLIFMKLTNFGYKCTFLNLKYTKLKFDWIFWILHVVSWDFQEKNLNF